MNSESISLRFNGVLPDVSSDAANTSISVHYKGFHLLVDAGNGVSKSIQNSGLSSPDAILITNSRKEHIADLPRLAKGKARIYCTAECSQQVTASNPSLADSIERITPSTQFDVGPFRVTALAAENAGDLPGVPGSVIYAVQADDKKIVAAWDFLTLPGANEKVLWNPDVLVIGAENYNDHPSTGMISVSEVYNIMKSWNAKTCYVVHYSGEKDKEDARNQWHRGPTGPLSPDALQSTINEHLKVSGEGKFTITVAKEGMTWTPPVMQEDEGEIGRKIQVEALDRHSFAIEKTDAGKVIVTIEDNINQLINEFLNPTSDGKSLHGEGVKSMLLKGPELNLVVSDGSVRIDITKGKKPMFAESLEISERDSNRLKKYLNENFMKVQAMRERSTAA